MKLLMMTTTRPSTFSSGTNLVRTLRLEDDRNKKDIAPLLRFFSKSSDEEYISLDDYVAAIYYVTGEGKEKAAVSPVVEKLTNRGCGDLYASEALDEIMLEALREYNDIDVKDAAKDNLNLGGDENDEEKKEKEAFTEGSFDNGLP